MRSERTDGPWNESRGSMSLSVKRIEPPSWASEPEVRRSDISDDEFAAIQAHRDELLEVVHREIETYLNDPEAIFDADEGLFPLRSWLTGAYYIARESYQESKSYWAKGKPRWVVIAVMYHCLESPKPGVDRDDDYLGLEVWLKSEPGPWVPFEVQAVDSSSI